MSYSKTEKTVLGYAEPIAAQQGLSVWDVEFKKEGKDYYLNVYLDKEGGVSIQDCENVSRALEAILDKEDPIPQAYVLVVSSAGLDRPLKRESDFLKFLGSLVDVKLYAPLNGTKEFTATLVGYHDHTVILEYEGQNLEIAQERFSSIRLSVVF